MYYLRLLIIDLPRLSFILSRHIFHAIILYVTLVVYLFNKKVLKKEKSRDLNLFFNKKDFTITLFEGGPDIAALVETFVYREYELKDLSEPKIIIDIGAHTGNTAIYFHIMYPEATIYAIEASPKNYRHLMTNVSSIKNIIPIHMAIAKSNGETTFYESVSSLGSSLLKRSNQDSAVVVPTQTLATFLKSNLIDWADLIKADIEGGEEFLFSGVKPESIGDCYIIEVHEDIMKISLEKFIEPFRNYELKVRDLRHPERHILIAHRS